MMRRCFLGFALSLLAIPASAQQPISLTTNTLRLAPGQASSPATLADMAFLVGHWTGDGLGGVFEEIWTAPKQGVMVGLYRGLKADGSPVFNELLLLREEKGSLMVRGVMHVDGMAFKVTGPDTVAVYLAIENKKDGTVREATFNSRRLKS